MFDGIAACRRCLAAVALIAACPAPAQELPMTAEGLNSALGQYFSGADRDQDQRIDRAEAAQALGFARSLLTAEREPEPFVMDVAPDGRPRLSLNEKGPLSTAGMVDIAYRLADRDSDDLLSLAEIHAVGRAAFAAADRDKDGILDETERAAAMEKLRLFKGVIGAVK